MNELDPSFTSLPLDALADAALARAKQLGASHADVRIERHRTAQTRLRDGKLAGASDSTDLGISIRVVHHGSWGFAAGITLTAEAARTLADQAVAIAQVSAPLNPRAVELAEEPVHTGTWVSSYEVNPFHVPDRDRVARLVELSQSLASQAGVSHTQASLMAVQENTFFANLAGTRTTQQRVRVHPEFTATNVSDSGFSSMRTIAPPAGRGWEYLTGTGWDFDAEIAGMGDHLAANVRAASVTAGPTDLVIDPSNLFLTIHESVAHGTELDRALGYEAAYAGTSFATFDQLGTLRYGSEVMNVTGDRVTEHGLATVGWDDEGVAAQTFDIIRDGTLVGYQLNRQMAHEKGLGRSNGCAFADSAGHIPLQRMPNVSLQPGTDNLSLDDLIGRVENGLYVVGDKSWSIDMQRFNFQFTGQRFLVIKDGRLTGEQVCDAAYQGTTTDFWGSMEAVGGPDTYLLAGAFNCGKGQPGQVAAVSHGAPACLFRGVNVLNTVEEGQA
ncbi:TldD/PmbA family protein [Aestuariimicrobium sp. T2.26MG-19.2B]|uniref:TldD/PmbA family protein n=1 Tax=Aestuariimicrobium sp. T2.26MG-19.2B TaxID=3040679 RepID=UPI002477618A|nr:TldD/PmbA family protein [Aestuariimicrobium sp. T2.26MG-19.2B]CAI9408229.1 Metalloprotease TldD [Aestuariimicrobium sp. T2.26MG-19.2B]